MILDVERSGDDLRNRRPIAFRDNTLHLHSAAHHPNSIDAGTPDILCVLRRGPAMPDPTDHRPQANAHPMASRRVDHRAEPSSHRKRTKRSRAVRRLDWVPQHPSPP